MDRIFTDEAERIVQTSTAICLLARGVYDLETISRALGSMGIERRVEDLKAMGEQVYWERVRLRERLGFQAQPEDVFQRFYEISIPRGQPEPERITRRLEIYQKRQPIVD